MDSLVLAAITLLVILLAAGYLYWKRAVPWGIVVGPEVYYYALPDAHGNLWDWQTAMKAAASLGGTMATLAQVTAAQKAGAQWCAWGWTQTGPGAYVLSAPRQVTAAGCGHAGVNQMAPAPNTLWGVLVYGRKPTTPPPANCAKGGICVLPWNDGLGSKAKWSQYSA